MYDLKPMFMDIVLSYYSTFRIKVTFKIKSEDNGLSLRLEVNFKCKM
jgi:hypothetical protein